MFALLLTLIATPALTGSATAASKGRRNSDRWQTYRYGSDESWRSYPFYNYRITPAVHDRDGDIPVVLQSLCLSRSHHLFGLVERNWRAIVLPSPARYSLRACDA
jgi:hypothetical protein